MSFRFENLTVWHDSRRFISLIYKSVKLFPKEERYGLSDQLKRAAISVALNIAEGSDRKSDLDFKRFLRMAIGSCEEVVTGIYIALDQGFINKENFDIIYKEANLLVAKLNALIKKL